LLAAAMAMLITVHSEAIVRAGYGLVQMKAEAAKLEKENDLLRLEIARMKAPQRIQQIATKELGMIVPQNTYYASVSPKPETPAVAAAPGKPAGQVASILRVSRAEASKGH
jgi:cell division protein FtsL